MRKAPVESTASLTTTRQCPPPTGRAAALPPSCARVTGGCPHPASGRAVDSGEHPAPSRWPGRERRTIAPQQRPRPASVVSSIGNGQLAGHNDSRPGKNAEHCQPTHERKGGNEDDQLQHIGRTGVRQRFPKKTKDRLADRDRPHRSIEVAALVTFPFSGSTHAGKNAK